MRWLIFPIGLVVCTGLGALGYLWFGVMEWMSLPGQISFGVVGLGWALFWVWLLPRMPIHPAPQPSDHGYYDEHPGWIPSSQAWEAKKNRRIVELTADPAKWKYLEHAERGDLISDLEIAYFEDPTMTMACVHLRDVEAAMRAEGISMRPAVTSEGAFRKMINCGCAVDMMRLKQRFVLADCVVWEELVEFVYEAGWVKCTACGSSLAVSLPKENGKAPVFPGGLPL